jgi:tetratricopeptide (TPR) repeat protein
MQYQTVRCTRKTELLLLVGILLQSILLSGCLPLFHDESAHPTGNAPPSSFYQQNQRPFQAEMDVPEYLNNSFEYDETAMIGDIHGKRRSDVPRYFWCELLNRTMAAFKYDYITKLCLFSVGAEAHYKRAFLLDILGYNDLAAIEYTEAIELNPQDDRYYNNRGNLYTLRGYLFLAVRDFDKAIEINPNKAQAYYNRARALEKMGNYDAAKLDYEKAVELGICKIYPSLKVCK